MKMTQEEKDKRKEERKKARTTAKELAQIELEKNQKPIESMTVTIEWKKSRMWGHNPTAEAEIRFKDGTFKRSASYNCSGCGYDKESTVLAYAFNDYLLYKLYTKRKWTDSINGEKTNHPYGVYYYSGKTGETYESGHITKPRYNGGVGVSCYRDIGKFIGGKFEKIASGRTFDVYKYTDRKSKR